MTLHECSFGQASTARAGALMLHGHGEHSARHQPHLELFAEHGIYCRSFDWPGHGRSPGQRGHLDSMEAITEIVRTQIDQLRAEIGPDKPIGLFGHSMGGFLALYHLVKYPTIADFAWIGSPLINPEANASPLKRRAARFLNRIYPRFSIASGVRSHQCRPGPEKRRDPLMHRRLSVRLGVILVEAAQELQERAPMMNPDLRLLMTHGSADHVCPPKFSRALFDRLPVKDKTYRLLDGVLHEPFHDETRDLFHQTLRDWISKG